MKLSCLPERTEARFVFVGDVVALFHPSTGVQLDTMEVQSVRFAGDDVLLEGIDVLGGEFDAHLYLDTPVEIRIYSMEARS